MRPLSACELTPLELRLRALGQLAERVPDQAGMFRDVLAASLEASPATQAEIARMLERVLAAKLSFADLDDLDAFFRKSPAERDAVYQADLDDQVVNRNGGRGIVRHPLT